MLRVARPQTRVEQVARTVEFVVRLAARGMEVTEPAAVSGLRQPVVTSTGVVTLWVYYEIDAGCRVTPRELGGLLRHFHDLAILEKDLVEPWEPFTLIRARLDGARRDGIEQDLVDPLGALLALLESRVPDLTSELGTGVMHGDMHYGNVMCLPGHRLLLIDFDQICRGPLEWDLVPNLVTYRRFGMSDENYESFSAAYGYDLRASPHVGTFIALRECDQQVVSVVMRARRHGDRAELRRARQYLRKLPSKNPQDPGYRRLTYVRYADDHRLGFTGPKAEAEQIKLRLATFLRDNLKLELSQDKTLVTHARTSAARFLGYEITVRHADNKLTAGRRAVSGVVALRVLQVVIKTKYAPYLKLGKPERRPRLMSLDDHAIISTYGAEYRGLVQYYLLTGDVWKLNRVHWVMLTSMLKALAAKHRSTVSTMAHAPGHRRHTARATQMLPSQR